MKAALIDQFSKNVTTEIVIRDIDPPPVRKGSVMVRMLAAGLNPADIHIASGEMKLMSPARLPIALGVDGAGIVMDSGAIFRKGDRVMFYTGLVHSGTLAEYMVVPEQWLAPVPSEWTNQEAAAAPLVLLVARRTLDRAAAKSGERLLVIGAGGPVGAATIALAVHRGLLVHGSGAAIDADYVRSLGAISYSDYRTVSARELTPHFDIALDTLGGPNFADCLSALKKGGRIVSLKAMTGTEDLDAMGMRIPALMRLLLPVVFRKPKRLSERAGVQLIGLASYQDGATLSNAVMEAVKAGYKPRIDSVYALDDIRSAFMRMVSGPRGKVVVQIS